MPAIVPEALWEQANRLLASRGKTMKAHAQASQNRYAYSGKLICARHGTTFHRHVYKSKSRGEAECWNCRLYREKGKTGRLRLPHSLQPRAGPHFGACVRADNGRALSRRAGSTSTICAPLPHSRITRLRLLKSSRKSKRSPAARTSCSISRLPGRSPTTSSNSATRPATSSLPPSSNSEQNYRTQTRHWKNVSDGWKICAASSRNGGR